MTGPKDKKLIWLVTKIPPGTVKPIVCPKTLEELMEGWQAQVSTEKLQ